LLKNQVKISANIKVKNVLYNFLKHFFYFFLFSVFFSFQEQFFLPFFAGIRLFFIFSN